VLKARKKTTRKEIKQDKLVTSYFEAKNWVGKEENKRKIFIGVGIIAALIIATFFYINHRKKVNDEAEIKLTAAMSMYDQGKYQDAMDGDSTHTFIGFKEIVNEFGGSENGQTAKFYLADCQYNLRDYDNALKNFEDYSGSKDILKASALAGIGAVYEVKNDLKKAAENYEKASKVNKDLSFNSEYIFYALRCYSHSGDKEDAKRLYSTLKNDYPKSKYVNDTKRFESEFND
jgi:TolA-binding protein